MTNAAHGVKPSELCTQHLNSTHAEIHQETGYVDRYGFRSTHLGHLRFGQFIPEEADSRHEELAHELDFRAKQSRTSNGHSSELECVCGVDADLFGFPVEALKLYQRNVFKNKDCNCLTGDPE